MVHGVLAYPTASLLPCRPAAGTGARLVSIAIGEFGTRLPNLPWPRPSICGRPICENFSMTDSIGGEKPTIHLIDSEADALSDLAMAAEARSSDVTVKLFEEIERAVICARDEIPAHVVTMGSHVEFVDEGSEAEWSVQLVWPGDGNLEEDRLSVMTLVGAGLIGMQEGRAIEWPDRSGHIRQLRIAKVRQPFQEKEAA